MNDATALLLIDLQRDFIEVPSLFPPAGVVVPKVVELLGNCRAAAMPVMHIRTIVAPDGSDRMPHWRRNDDRRCVAGSRGAEPPEGLEERPPEVVFTKRFHSAFDSAELHAALRDAGVGTVLVAGVHTHACVYATVLDAYRLGYAVRLVTDAISSYAPLHADLTIRHLAGRVCDCTTIPELFPMSAGRNASSRGETFAVAHIDGRWESASGHRMWEMRDPCDWQRILGSVPIACSGDVSRATAASAKALTDWAGRARSERLGMLGSFTNALARREAECIELLIREVGKPRVESEAEFRFATNLMRATIEQVACESAERRGDVVVRYRPRGVVAVVTPWNNPLALPIGKIVPALAYGNTVVWKPALQAPELVRTIVEAATEAGLPLGCLNVVFGDPDTARSVLQCAEIAAVTFTGSEDAGREIAVACSMHGLALQSELGGNNAALVAASADVERAARELAAAAFSFSGQRCTAPRRIVLVEAVFERFCEALAHATHALKVGRPGEEDTKIGPLISRSRQAMMGAWVQEGLRNGGRLLAGGKVPEGFQDGCWFEPTVLTGLPENASVVQEETFGPLVVVQQAANFDHGISLCNGVRQGLRAILYTDDVVERARFVEKIEVGVVHLEEAATRIDIDAPFLGWKSSGTGVAEHGRWDREFYTRVQAVYGPEDGSGDVA